VQQILTAGRTAAEQAVFKQSTTSKNNIMATLWDGGLFLH